MLRIFNSHKPPDVSEDILARICQKNLFASAQMVSQLTPYLSNGGRTITIGSCAEKQPGFVITGNYPTARALADIGHRNWSKKNYGKHCSARLYRYAPHRSNS